VEPEPKRSKGIRLKEFSRAHAMILPALAGTSLYVLLGLVIEIAFIVTFTQRFFGK
jgi:hypothetical protein